MRWISVVLTDQITRLAFVSLQFSHKSILPQNSLKYFPATSAPEDMPQKVGLAITPARPGSHTLLILKAKCDISPCEIFRIIAMLKETVHTKITERKMQWERWLTLIQWFATTFGTSGILGGHKDWLYQSTVRLFMTKQDIIWCLLILQPWSTIKLHILNIFNISLYDVI